MQALLAAAAAVIVILTGIATAVRGLVHARRAWGAAREAELAAKEGEVWRLVQRRRSAAANREIARALRETRLPRGVAAGDDLWASTSASGYGSVIRDNLRRRGITPADYARGWMSAQDT